MVSFFFYKKNLYRLLVWSLIAALFLGVASCGMAQGKHSAASVQKKMRRKKRKQANALVREYDKMYKAQTKKQAKEQRKRIKKGRRKPKMMRRRHK